MWQKEFKKHGGENVTIVGLALDAEGIPPAKRYYDQFGVSFPALVDTNYATKFTFVPRTFFIDELGVVRKILRDEKDWDKLIQPRGKLKPVTDSIRKQWSALGSRLEDKAMAELRRKLRGDPGDLTAATQLASRYLDLKNADGARQILESAVARYDPLEVARGKDKEKINLLGDAYFQLSRALEGNRKVQVQQATLAFFLKPSVGYGKQIARIMAPEKFDRPDGKFDNNFREATLRRLQKERQAWLNSK